MSGWVNVNIHPRTRQARRQKDPLTRAHSRRTAHDEACWTHERIHRFTVERAADRLKRAAPKVRKILAHRRQPRPRISGHRHVVETRNGHVTRNAHPGLGERTKKADRDLIVRAHDGVGQAILDEVLSGDVAPARLPRADERLALRQARLISPRATRPRVRAPRTTPEGPPRRQCPCAPAT